MPIYEYTCKECGAPFQARRAMKEADAPIPCPKCGSCQVRRGLSRFFVASSDGGALKGTSGGSGCASCSGGSCSTCGH